MATDIYKDDPTATYRGYRRQALYCLYRLFDDSLPDDQVLQPEGHEDLAIRDKNDVLIEVVQVKDYSSNLTASKFKPTFYRRITKYCSPDSKVAVTIASFGKVGPELESALDNSKQTPKRAIETLTKERVEVDSKGIKTSVTGRTKKQAEEIFSHVTLEEVNETDLTNQLMKKLSKVIGAGDAARAFENLMWWLVTSAEKQERISRDKTIAKIDQIGKFLTHRAAYEHEWNISIKPVLIPDTKKLNKAKLESEYFEGGRVRVEHVACEFDVRREEELGRIHTSFEQQNVVVLRAASGQGKTTLAYRYLLDMAPSDFRFEVLRASDLQHARRMATAISGHTEAIDVPTLIYVDVRPGDSLWVEFVRELSAIDSVRVLVTIREEDWFRSRVTKDDFPFTEISLVFDEATASKVFRALSEIGKTTASHLNFDEAWGRLGHRKTMFEFVYLITQDKSLAGKIIAQIANLKDQVNDGKLSADELELLRLGSV